MSVVTNAWITWARLRRKVRRRPHDDGEEARRAFVRDHASGRSFLDVGGLYGYEGDIAFLAEESGATTVTVFDAGDPDLCAFDAKRRERSSKVRFVQGDLEDPASVDRVGVHDVVWCTGVVYHTPNPVRQLLHLRELTGSLLYLGSHTVPEVPGVRQACVYYPLLDERSRRAYASAHANPEQMAGLGAAFDDTPMHGHANYWWGITPSALRAMLATARFEVVEERRLSASPFLTELIARPIDDDPILPPLSYYRERGEVRERDGKRLPFEDFYRAQ